MFRNGKFKTLEHINVNFDQGGIGDCVAQMPAIVYMRDHVPNVVQHVWVPDYFLDFAKKICPGVYIKSHTEAKKKFNPKLHTVKLSTTNMQHTNMAYHMVDFAFNVLVDTQVSIEHKNYLKLNINSININRFNLPNKYIVLTTGFTALVREMLPEIANGIIDYCTSKNIKVVTLGSHNATTGSGHTIKGSFNPSIKFNETVNLIGQTSLLEAGAIMSGALCVVGLDNGLLHIAACTEVPIIYGFSSVIPEHRLPYRHNQMGWNCYTVTPDKSLECGGCQSKMLHVKDHDFRRCYYTDYDCLPQLTAEKYIAYIDKIIYNGNI